MHLRATNSNNNNGTTSLLGMTEAKRKPIVKQHATEHDESPKTKAKHSMCRVRVRKSWIESNWMNEFERLHRSKSTTDRQFIHRWTVGVDGVSHYVCDELMFRSRPTHTQNKNNMLNASVLRSCFCFNERIYGCGASCTKLFYKMAHCTAMNACVHLNCCVVRIWTMDNVRHNALCTCFLRAFLYGFESGHSTRIDYDFTFKLWPTAKPKFFTEWSIISKRASVFGLDNSMGVECRQTERTDVNPEPAWVSTNTLEMKMNLYCHFQLPPLLHSSKLDEQTIERNYSQQRFATIYRQNSKITNQTKAASGESAGMWMCVWKIGK